MPPRTSYRSDIEMLIVPDDMPRDSNSTTGDVQMEDVEKHASARSIFTNEDVDSLAWKDLTVTVKDRSTGKYRNILDNASGIVRPGELVALMGPSGSGKTTLLHTLAQRQTATVRGQVLVNGEEHPLTTHRAISSFVEQEDTLIGSLTVEETLKFAARLSLPRTVTRHEAKDRVSKLIEAFGLNGQRNTLIGTPLQKGISGGQKRRVSVATQLITGPRVLYLDEPTSGLDSTASYEVISFIRDIARRNKLIVIASIHQPSTKTFDLFSKVTLLSQGKTVYNGSVPDMSAFFAEMGMPIPAHINPAEEVLDLINVDFSGSAQSNLDTILLGWQNSTRARQIQEDIKGFSVRKQLQLSTFEMKPTFIPQTITLLHRAMIKSYRDLVAYWVRVAMYMGLAIMMGTVWLRLGSTQQNIQPFVNAIFFGSAFMSFMAVAYVPAFLEDRAIFVKERANGLYGPTAFLVSNFIIGLPYLFLISVLFSIVSYWLINLRPDAGAFFTWIMWLFLDLVAAESLVVFMASLFPNFVVALALIAFANGLWMSVGGFLVSLPVLNAFWKYVFHYIDYQAYVFQGMMVNEFRARSYSCEQIDGQCFCSYPSELQSECRIAGTAVLSQYGYALGREGKWVGIMIAIIVVYRLLGWAVTWSRKS
ncbi:Putative AAA+ ATPase domain, ABC-2 type transporter, ABC transporter [Septoria linicola]|uniref:AAA+ ATPase domain, ABC-2 type transporter, ABC transporter n=1 Tax=Septoria linicola TaxID=215465 RepID=A0A9Q9EIJ3_9PEZI|nr:putative AAA+ ATPase domain, ABC-2 type transporter, ABC transporter [Septoria linicola]USW51107.1 Putative AAA+ ATPase domain, ABC-2 type transporter, ABC transporter [Septoria linicola]